VGGIGGLQHKPRPPARHQPGPHHRGTRRTTQICRPNLLTMPWAGPGPGEHQDPPPHRRERSSAGDAGRPWAGRDSPMFAPLLEALSVPRAGPGRPRTRPEQVLGDKGLLVQGESAAAPSPPHQLRHPRTRRPDRPPPTPRIPRLTTGNFDRDQYKGRNVVERSFNQFKQWRGLATRYDKLALTYRGGVVLAPSPSGYANKETRSSRSPKAMVREPRPGFSLESGASLGPARGLVGLRCRRSRARAGW
jgi:hypothetical protein